MTAIKNQHQIPKTYINSFVDITQSESTLENKPFTPFVWLIDKSFEVEPYKKSPKKSLRKNRFYNLDNDDEESPIIEKALSIIERKYTEVLKKILEQQVLTEQDIIDLTIFIEALHHRTEINIDKRQDEINEFERIYRCVDEGYNGNQEISHDFFKGSHEAAKRLIITGIGAIGKRLFESGFLLVFNESEMNFFSSDNPVSWIHIHIDELQRWNLDNEWLRKNVKNNHKKFFCFCPLTPKIALLGSPFLKKAENEIYKYVSCNNFQFAFFMNLLTQSRANFVLISNTANPYGVYRRKVVELLQSLRNIEPSKGKELLIYTNEARYRIEIEKYERENINPIFTSIKFWTQNYKLLREIAKDHRIEAVHIFENGIEVSGSRNLRFDFVSLLAEEPSVLIQCFS